jgi:hypothetical protein
MLAPAPVSEAGRNEAAANLVSNSAGRPPASEGGRASGPVPIPSPPAPEGRGHTLKPRPSENGRSYHVAREASFEAKESGESSDGFGSRGACTGRSAGFSPLRMRSIAPFRRARARVCRYRDTRFNLDSHVVAVAEKNDAPNGSKFQIFFMVVRG